MLQLRLAMGIRTKVKQAIERLQGPPAIAVSPAKYCCLCNSTVPQFNPYRGGWKNVPELMIVLDVTGSDVDNFSCPACGAHDRERHLYLYLERLHLGEHIRGARVLHFAPEGRLSQVIESLEPARYIKADLFPTHPGIQKVNLLEMPFESRSFDVVIANHVLEHVADDRQALAEIRRVLSPGGTAILQTPYSARLKATFEDAGIDDDHARLLVYGQEDHVRLYGSDIFERFASSGLMPEVRRHADVLSDIDPTRYGVNPKEPLFLYRNAGA